MLVYVLPIILFVINLMIIIMVRSESNRTSRNKNITQSIISMRNEAVHLENRLAALCAETDDTLKRSESRINGLIQKAEASYDVIVNYIDDMEKLQSICANYEKALHKLKVQTEQAQEKIDYITDRVAQSESIYATFEDFVQKNEAARVTLTEIESDYNALIAKTNDEILAMFANHKESLNQEKIDFKTSLDTAYDKLAAILSEKEESFNLNAQTTKDELETIKNEYNSLVETTTSDINNLVSENKAVLNTEKETFRQDLERISDEFNSTINAKEAALETNSKETIDELNSIKDAARTSFNDIKDETVAEVLTKATSLLDEINQTISDYNTDKEAYLNTLESNKATLEELGINSTSSVEKAKSDAIELIESEKEKHLEKALEQINATGSSVNKDISKLQDNTEALAINIKESVVMLDGNIVDIVNKSLEELSELKNDIEVKMEQLDILLINKKNIEVEISEAENNKLKIEKESDKIVQNINKNKTKLAEVKKSVMKAEVKAIKLKVLSKHSLEDDEEIDLLDEDN